MSPDRMKAEVVLRLIAERRKRKLQAKDVAERCGVSAAAFCKWENGASRPTLDNLFAWAWALGLSLRLTPNQPAVNSAGDA